MPTVLRIYGYRFFFFSNEGNEPPHIHVEKDDSVAKFWLEPLEFSSSNGFNARELREISKLTEENIELFKLKWHEYFNK
jgi:hypothetical protein